MPEEAKSMRCLMPFALSLCLGHLPALYSLMCCVHARVRVCAHGTVEQGLQGVSFPVRTHLEQLRHVDVVRMDANKQTLQNILHQELLGAFIVCRQQVSHASENTNANNSMS